MNCHLRSLHLVRRRNPALKLYSSAAATPSRVLPTVLLVGGASVAGVGGYYYYDPNAELFRQARNLMGVDNQATQQQQQKAQSPTTTKLVSSKKPEPQQTSRPVERAQSVPVPPPPSPKSAHTQAPPPPTPPPQKQAASPPPPPPPPQKSPSPTILASTAAAAATTAAAALPVAPPPKEKDTTQDVVPKQILVTALRAQQEALVESHDAKLKTIQREYDRKLKNAEKVSEADRVVELRGKYEKASAALSAIEKGIEARSDQNTRAKRLRALWAQVNALHARVNHPEYHGGNVTQIDKGSLLRAIEVPDRFVIQMVESLPSSPVHSLESLKDRFYNELQPVANQVSLIKPGEGFSLLKYACGKVFSWGVAEIKTDPKKSSKPESTSQVLDSAKASLEQGDLLSAAVAVNQLSGLPKQVASDWLADARTLLETNQTLFVLMTYAASNNVF